MTDDLSYRSAGAAAQTALRKVLGLSPKIFPVAAFIGMISEKIEQLRAAGHPDNEIAAFVSDRPANLSTPKPLPVIMHRLRPGATTAADDKANHFRIARLKPLTASRRLPGYA